MLPPHGGGISGEAVRGGDVGRHELIEFGLVDTKLESLQL